MLDALLKGKLSREVEGMEDILTSTVFGAFKYAEDVTNLWTFLSDAKTLEGKRLMEILPPPASVGYDFWPWWASDQFMVSCEPDLVLTLTHEDGTQSLLLIEAKYRSGKSSEDSEESAQDEPSKPMTQDQLAREWLALVSEAKSQQIKRFALIYLTANFVEPRSDIQASLHSIRQNQYYTVDGPSPCIYWLSWRHTQTALNKEQGHSILIDLRTALAERLKLTFFSGITLAEKRVQSWNYKSVTSEIPKVQPSSRNDFDWHVTHPKPIGWRYEG